MISNKIDTVTLISGIQDIVNTVTVKGGYVVLVCPSTDITKKTARIVGSLISENEKFSGRTVVFPNKGKLSVVCADEKMFILDEESFKTEFVGWSSKDNHKGMLKWQSRAKL